MLLKATSFRVVDMSRKVNRMEFLTRKLVLTVFMTTTKFSMTTLCKMN